MRKTQFQISKHQSTRLRSMRNIWEDAGRPLLPSMTVFFPDIPKILINRPLTMESALEFWCRERGLGWIRYQIHRTNGSQTATLEADLFWLPSEAVRSFVMPETR